MNMYANLASDAAVECVMRPEETDVSIMTTVHLESPQPASVTVALYSLLELSWSLGFRPDAKPCLV